MGFNSGFKGLIPSPLRLCCPRQLHHSPYPSCARDRK